MKTIKDIFVTGKGPSSSHTMGPRKASIAFLEAHPEATAFRVTLYGSLAATGKGHLTDVAIEEVFEGVAPLEIIWRPQEFLPFHPNAMLFESLDSVGEVTDSQIIYSVGGGSIIFEGLEDNAHEDIYPMTTMTDIMEWCNNTGRSYWEYVFQYEDEDIKEYLLDVWNHMRNAVRNGLRNEGALPGPLNLRRKAASYFVRSRG